MYERFSCPTRLARALRIPTRARHRGIKYAPNALAAVIATGPPLDNAAVNGNAADPPQLASSRPLVHECTERAKRRSRAQPLAADGPPRRLRAVVRRSEPLSHSVLDGNLLCPEGAAPAVPLEHLLWPFLRHRLVQPRLELYCHCHVAAGRRDDDVPPPVWNVQGVASPQHRAVRGGMRKAGEAVEVDAIGGDGREAEMGVEVGVEPVRLARMEEKDFRRAIAAGRCGIEDASSAGGVSSMGADEKRRWGRGGTAGGSGVRKEHAPGLESPPLRTAAACEPPSEAGEAREQSA